MQRVKCEWATRITAGKVRSSIKAGYLPFELNEVWPIIPPSANKVGERYGINLVKTRLHVRCDLKVLVHDESN